ncbi:EF-P 5-aminopentanol modification-associated protein YfmF [Streptococcus ratti]|uniref:Peptidase n=1 Tax=Streptococcus ratti FA-1 = DSM 20564 TaxID=699248 RepID=A0ABP2R0A4_STRRT|nr:pitrilysin family protein [Streptococcus ratti]EJN94759.1 putative peptidase [Streptococcus ratti FA-1 = DSM 20564]EMP69933.1 peptidase [Streptococcus ratti FA-1 = DSM 20564]QEY06675.1 insulinase family protein [Streptococcus ratti]VEI61025.1 peptidase [Streptococcus mutans]
MKLAQDVHLHLIKTTKFKTNHITFRFSGELNSKTLARRVLVAQMLVTANNAYPTPQIFREKLANLYGARFSTQVSAKGQVHIVDIDISFVSDRFVPEDGSILEEIVGFLREVLFNPLASVEHYQSKSFDLEKANLMRYLKADKEDPFYYSHLELQKLFFKEKVMQHSKDATADLVAAENSYTAYQEFQKMLKEDRIDIFALGNFDDYHVLQLVEEFPLKDRQKELNFFYQQHYSKVVQEKVEQRENQQSILQLGYHLPVTYGDSNYHALLVFNGILGAFPHSKLFTEIREKQGLAYSIGSHFDSYRGLLQIYTGIDSKKRPQTFQLINKQFNDLKLGRFSSHLLNQTKKMLINNVQLSEDHPKSMINYHYNCQFLKKRCLAAKDWIDKVNEISKEDVVRVANLIKLQSIYFLEGE